MTDPRTLLREDLKSLTAYGAPQLDVAVRLNTNENPFSPPPELVEDLVRGVRAAAEELNRYPDREATALRTELAAYLGSGVSVDQTWAANGSNEILQQLLMAFGGPGRRAVGFVPSYSMHQLIAQATGTAWHGAQRPGDFSLDPRYAARVVQEQKPDVVFLCSPNNPTGAALEAGVVEAVLDVAPGLVVVDEAYAEFSHRPSVLGLLPAHRTLVVTRTMSKAFALAGARIGYLAADPALVDALRLVRLPYHLSALTQAAGLAALRHADATLATVAELRRQRDRLVGWLRDEAGVPVVESDANFVLFGGFPDQSATWRAMLDRGVLVRDVGLPGWLRVTVSHDDDMAAFRAAFTDVLKELQ